MNELNSKTVENIGNDDMTKWVPKRILCNKTMNTSTFENL